MTSEKQIKANQENAQLSTGPKSSEGKTLVSGNAIKHGLFSKKLLLEDESREEFEEIKNEFYEKFKPQGLLEVLFLERALSAVWRLTRITKIEALIIADTDNPPFKKGKISDSFGGYYGKQLDLMSRYEITLEKILFRSLTELRSLQYNRQWKPLVN